MRTSAAALVLSLAIASGARGEAPTALPSLPGIYPNPAPTVLADFTLTDHQGKPRPFSSLRGSPVLVFFGFTHCPNACPATMGQLKLLHGARDGALKDARVLLVSVDGERDTPARLRQFLGPLSADFIGLTGDPKATRGIAAQFAAVFFKEPEGQDGSYNVMHTTQVYAVDKAGRLRATFKDASLEDMATVTALLLAEPG